MKNTTSLGTGLSTIVFLVFLVLKLTDTIDWSWWWVTSPLWLPIFILLSILLLWGLIVGLIAMFKK